jgi:CheY-like chemotaxis protein
MEQSANRRLRLLVVEDEAMIAMELEDILVDLGHEVLEVCGTVPRAVAVVAARADALDGAIIDANLGGVSAVPVAEALAEHRVPFLVASGYALEEVRRLGFRAPRIRKPYSREEIAEALRSFAGPR